MKWTLKKWIVTIKLFKGNLHQKYVMKNKICIFLLCSWGIISVLNGQSAPNKIHAMRKQFMNEQLKLTEEEKKKFWPLADEFLMKEKELRMNYNLKMEFLPDSLTARDADNYYSIIKKFYQDDYELFKEYSEKIRNTIGTAKTVKFFALREQFKKKMLRRMAQPERPFSPSQNGQSKPR